jgi:membrane associated rhomboid family serine protease
MLLAVAVTLATWRDHSLLYNFTLDARAVHGEPWRFVVSALPHGTVMHLAFNLYWLWVFGTLLEERFGHFVTFGLYVVLAAISGGAEYALLAGGIGLSGIGYGLLGMLWMLGRADRRFDDAVDARTVQLFLLWGVLCIVTTVTNVMPIANIAHGIGLVAGVIIGRAIGVNRSYWAALGLLTLAVAAGASRYRPVVNLGRHKAAEHEAYAADRASDAHKPALAAAVYRAAFALDPALPYWVNLANLDEQLGDSTAARADLERGCEHGDGGACTSLGIMREEGKGGSVDMAGAAVAYSRACEVRAAAGCYDRALLLLNGDHSDRSAARDYFERACSYGLRDGCTKRDLLDVATSPLHVP